MSLFVRSLDALLRASLELLGDALSPAACAACDARLSARSVFCSACAAGLIPPEAGGVVAAGSFEGPLARALRRFKYEGRPDLARPLGHLLRRAVRDAGIAGDLVVPVPLHPRRLAERGYNQAALLANAVATEISSRLAPRALVRVRSTPQQALLDRAARLKNVAKAFEARDPLVVRGARVVVVDDVATTGSTLAACADALLEAGAASVVAVVVARAGAHGGDSGRDRAEEDRPHAYQSDGK